MSRAAGSGVLQGAVLSQGNDSVNSVPRNAHVLPLWLRKNSAQLGKFSYSVLVLSVWCVPRAYSENRMIAMTRPLSQIRAGKIKTNHILRPPPMWPHCIQMVSEAKLCFRGSV